MMHLDGTALSKRLQSDIAAEVEGYASRGNRRPGLGVILVGDNPASHVYVRNKGKIAERCGLVTFDRRLSNDASDKEVATAIAEFNEHPEIDGILLQLPLPKHLDGKNHLVSIRPDKDADGLHPANQGALMTGVHGVRPCTPLGVMKLIDLAVRSISAGSVDLESGPIPEADLSGKNAIVIGRSVLVGKPSALMLLERNATVVMAHSRTKDLESRCREADIVVAAVGVPELVKGSWVKDGAVVIDVGMNRLEGVDGKAGKLVGDVAYDEVSKKAAALTPVPGGVGPMTILFLIDNTVRCYRRHLGLDG